MNDLIHEHPSPDVRQAAIRLLDALCMWERNTGRHHVLILRDSIGCDYRVLDNAPQPEHISDADLLEAFDNLRQEQNAPLGATGSAEERQRMNQPTRPAETVSSERLLAAPNPRLDAAEDVLWAARKYGHWLEAQWGKSPNDMIAGEYETVRERLCNAVIKYASMCPANVEVSECERK